MPKRKYPVKSTTVRTLNLHETLPSIAVLKDGKKKGKCLHTWTWPEGADEDLIQASTEM